MTFELEINMNNIKIHENFLNDSYLEEIITITINCTDIHILNYIQDMFYLRTTDEYENKYQKSCLAIKVQELQVLK